MTESYRDQVVIEIRQITDRYAPSPQVVDGYSIVIHPHDTIDLDWLNAQLEDMFVTRDESGIPVHQTPYVLKQRRTETHWGAAGSQAQFLIETAGVIAAGATGAVLGNELQGIVSKLKAKGYEVRHGKLQTLTPDEIGQHGLRAIEATFGVPLSDLTLRTTETNENNEHTASARGPNDTQYVVTFIVRGGETQVQTSRRELA